MNRSLVTFAITLAAAMDMESPSPFTRASCGTVRPFTGKPSIRAMSGLSASAASANPIARCVARRMLILSISSGPTISTAQMTLGFPVISA